MGYGWDFAPRLVRLGILGPVTLRETGPARLYDLWVRTTPDLDSAQATVDLAVTVDGPPDALVDLVSRRGGRVLARAAATAGPGGLAWARLTLPRPALWWPNGQGDQPLYEATATCADGSDAVAATFGIRTLRWAVRPGAPDDEWPLTLEVNGRPIFQRGWNWVPADSMGGPRADRRARRLLASAQAAGANMLRCWGGGDPETPAFYAACDRLGLLVWQEFPLSSAGISNTPPADPAYLARIASYAPAVIAARRNHPSLVLWGGGNELTTPDGVPLALDHPYAATLAAAVATHDPDRAFRPSSPLGPIFDADPDKGPLWDVHGPWDYSRRQPGPQYWRVNAITPALHSEFGLPGAASLAGRPRYLSRRYQAAGPDNPAVRHHGGAWWSHDTTLAAVFGPTADLAVAVAASQWLQAEGLRYYVEETRRRWPRSAGIFPWQLDEPWPNVVCTSAVEYDGTPKPAYFAVAGAYRPVVASARYLGLTLPTDAPLAVEIWLLSETTGPPVDVTATLEDPQGRPLHESATFAGIPGSTPQRLATLGWDLPPGYRGLAVLTLAWAGRRNRYVFSNADGPALRALLDVPDLLEGMFAPEGD